MKVTIEKNEEKEQEITFPCLMIVEETEVIILASSKNKDRTYNGVCLHVGNNNAIFSGEYKDYWSEKFKPLPEGTKVILEN